MKLRIIKNRSPSSIPADSHILSQSQQLQQNFHYYKQSPIKRHSLNSLRLNNNFLTRLINHQFQLNQPKAQMFSNSLLFYTTLINDPNISENQLKRLLININDKYTFTNCPQQLGLLIGYLVILRVDSQQHKIKTQITQTIQRLYSFTDKDRLFCDLSKIMYVKILDLMKEFVQIKCQENIMYCGWQHYQHVENKFEEFYFSKQAYFRQLWTDFKYHEPRHQHQVVMVIQRLIKMKARDPHEKSLQLWAFLFMIKFIISQHNYTPNKISQQLTKIISSVIVKLSHIIINIDFKHMNWFLTMYKFIMTQEREFFTNQIRQKLHLALLVARIYFNDYKMLYFNNVGKEFCQKTENMAVFKNHLEEMYRQFPYLATLTLVSQNYSQLLSYGSPFNQRRKASFQPISKYLSSNSGNNNGNNSNKNTNSNNSNKNSTTKQQKPFIPMHKLNSTLMTHKAQILRYTQQRLQKQQYLQLLVSLQQIYLMFQTKIKQLTNSIADDMRHEKLKDLQTWYVASYMRILLQLKSQYNYLYQNGFMSIDFVSQFYNEIVSRFTELTIVDIDFEELYKLLYLEYSVEDTVVFDIDSERFGLRELFDILGKREALMGSSISMYEIQTLKKYYNLVCNGSIVIQRDSINNNNNRRDDKVTIHLQKFVQRILRKKQLMGNKMKSVNNNNDSNDKVIKKRQQEQYIKQGQSYQQEKEEKKQYNSNNNKSNNYKNKNINNKATNTNIKSTTTTTTPTTTTTTPTTTSTTKQQKKQFINSVIPTNSPNPIQTDQYTLQFTPTVIKKFPSSSTVPYYFIKSDILRLVQEYLQYYPLSPFTNRKIFYQIFCSLIIVLDNQHVLLDIYANILYRLMSDKNAKLVVETYDSFALVRKLHSEKFKFSFKPTQLARKEITCMFQKLRKIQIKRNKQRNKTLSSTMAMNGKQKASLSGSERHEQQQSKVYRQYFEHLFNTHYSDVIIYGRQLFNLRKYKQCIFVMEIVRQQLNILLKRLQRDVFFTNEQRGNNNNSNTQQVDRMGVQKIMAQCDLLLSDCYATMVRQFRSTQGYINKKCVLDKVQDEDFKKMLKKQMRQYYKSHKISRNNNNSNGFLDISQYQDQSQCYDSNHSLIPELTQLITNHYTQQTITTYSPIDITDIDSQSYTQRITYYEQQFRSACYSTTFNYCWKQVNSICSMKDLQLFYTNMLLSGTLYGWYQEKYIDLMQRMISQRFNRNALQKKQQFPDDQLDQYNDYGQNIDIISNPNEQTLPRFAEIIRSFSHSLKSITDKLQLIKMIHVVECQKKQYNFQTIRMLNHSLLQTGNQQVIFAYLKKYYEGIDKYENMGLLDLEILQKYHYALDNYQHVKAITKTMKNQKFNPTYGQKESYYPNWPQVYGYELIAKIYDLNCIENPQKYWRDIGQIITEQKYVFVEGKRFSLQKLRKQKNLAKQIQKSSPKIFAGLVIELQKKIKQYFDLLRIIFSKLSLSKNEGSLSIFEIMQYLYIKMFIPYVTREQINVDFFLYYLRFLCEKVDPKYFLVRQANNDKIKKRKQQTGQINQQSQFILLKKKLILFLLDNLPYVKHHTLYMIRSMDPQVNTQKNIILRDILVQIFINNPVENLWTLTYLKYYEKKLPEKKKASQKSFEKKDKYYDKKKQKQADLLSRYIYPQDSQINQIHNAAIQQLYREVSKYIQPSVYAQLTMIPMALVQWLERTAMQKADDRNKPGEAYYFAKLENIMKQKDEINKKIKTSSYRIPYPFDNKMYIKSVQNVKLSIYEGKSMPCFVSFICGYYNEYEVENRYINNPKNKSYGTSQSSFTSNQPNPSGISKHILLKNNFSFNDHRIETNTANFYKQIGLLDQETTYGILNLTKYILIIQKICTPHKSLKEVLSTGFNFNCQQATDSKFKFFGQVRKQCFNRNYLYEPKWFDLTQQFKDNENLKNGYMFYNFYQRIIEDYNNINQWWQYMHNYVRTLAYWSYACFVTKLGDRHLTNILISTQGKFIHIDYQYNFGTGLLLAYPQWVPFRLTEFLIQPLGAFKQKGMFMAYFVEIAKIFNPNQERIWKALCHFSPSQRQLIEATSKFETIKTVNTIEEKCQKIIDLAKDTSLLRLMFAGWNSDI